MSEKRAGPGGSLAGELFVEAGREYCGLPVDCRPDPVDALRVASSNVPCDSLSVGSDLLPIPAKPTSQYLANQSSCSLSNKSGQPVSAVYGSRLTYSCETPRVTLQFHEQTEYTRLIPYPQLEPVCTSRSLDESCCFIHSHTGHICQRLSKQIAEERGELRN